MPKTKEVLIDPTGKEYPTEYLDKDIVRREELFDLVFEAAQNLIEHTKEAKEAIFSATDNYLDKMAKRKKLEGWKGNVALKDFAQKRIIKVMVRDVIDFDEKLQLAKQKIDKCLNDWTEGADEKIKLLIDNAFEVDKKGNLNKQNIMKLKTLKFKDSNWKAAMQLISEAIYISKTRRYIALHVKDEDGKTHQLNMNFSSI